MTQFAPPPNRPGKGSLFGAVLLLSVVSHGLVLRVPLPQSREAMSSLSDESDALSVVVLPERQPSPGQAIETQGSPGVESPIREQDAFEFASPPVPSELPPDPAVDEIVPELIAPSPESVVVNSQPLAPPPPEASPAPQPDPAEVPVEDLDMPQYGEPASPEPDSPLLAYGMEFPHPATAIAGCFGLTDCRRVSGEGSYRSVARSLIADLETQGYQVSLRHDLEDTGRNVYELISPEADGAVNYLIVFSDSDGSAVYIMSDQILTLRDLQALTAEAKVTDQAG